MDRKTSRLRGARKWRAAPHRKAPGLSGAIVCALRASAVCTAFFLVAFAVDAHAFTTSSAISDPCHETITMEALREARLTTPAAGPLAPVTRDDRALIDDLPFDVDGDMRDLGAVTLLTGVRFNDLKGRAPNEVDSLAQIHGNPSTQNEHCLRSPTADEPNGSEIALGECRAFVRDKVLDALRGLDEAGKPDPNARVTMRVDLSLRGGVDASLPRYFARMGEALHAVQDGFSHSYRVGDRTKVTAVLNYVELVDKEHEVARDGPAHSRELDRCDAPDEIRARNRALARLASVELISASLDSERSTEEKMVVVDGILDRYFSYQPGCNATNRWCNAPEALYVDDARCSCTVPGAFGSDALRLLLVAVLLPLAFARRRRLSGGFASGFVALLASSVTSSLTVLWSHVVAHAEPPETHSAPASRDATDLRLGQDDMKAVQKEENHSSSPFALYGAGAASFSNPAFAGILGARLRLSDHWVAGLDGEINGWYGVHSGRLRTGATNVYGTLIVRFPLRFEAVNLRSSLQFGTAVQMLDLYGVPKGSVGIFAGLNPLGLEWKLSSRLYAILHPLGVAVPVTQLTGAPFAYPQYRATIGLELAL